MYSYVNIYDTFKDIATKHKQINTFGWGDIWEIATSGDVTYPLMWVSPDGAEVSRGEVGNKFTILVMDKVLSAEINELDVLNDTQLILLDVIAELQNQKFSISLKNDRVTLTDFTERFVDSVAGWSASVTLWVAWDSARCDVPTNTLKNTHI